MTADEARDRIGDIRAELRRAMRAINRPEPDWDEAERALDEANDITCSLCSDCVRESWRKDD